MCVSRPHILLWTTNLLISVIIYMSSWSLYHAVIRRAGKNKYLKRKEDAAALGRTIDDMLTADEREAVEAGYYNQFKKLLLYVGVLDRQRVG